MAKRTSSRGQTLVHLLLGILSVAGASAWSQEPQPPRTRPDLATQIDHIGDAEVQTVVRTGYFPNEQPAVYWHDPKWQIDLVLPTHDNEPFSLRIRSQAGPTSFVKLPERARQVNTIMLAADNKAILDADFDSESEGFVIIDLARGEVVDDVIATGSFFSPNRRFVLYDNWFSNWDDSVPRTYPLYDLLRTPKQNTCGYDEITDRKHEQLGDYLRGIQVFPPKPRGAQCSVDDPSDGNLASNFTWASDSSKIVFADYKSNTMSLVLVTMPTGTTDTPRTFVYRLKGPEDICARKAETGQPECDSYLIRSISWDGNVVRFEPQSPLHVGTALANEFRIPIGKFTPLDQ